MTSNVIGKFGNNVFKGFFGKTNQGTLFLYQSGSDSSKGGKVGVSSIEQPHGVKDFLLRALVSDAVGALGVSAWGRAHQNTLQHTHEIRGRLSHTTMRSWYPIGQAQTGEAVPGRKICRNFKPSSTEPQFDVVYHAVCCHGQVGRGGSDCGNFS